MISVRFRHALWPLFTALAVLLCAPGTNAEQEPGRSDQAQSKPGTAKSGASKPASRAAGDTAKASSKPKATSRSASKGAPPRSCPRRPPTPSAAQPVPHAAWLDHLQDRYAPSDDSWTRPPWRQASFFGIRARGQFFVYVLDQSGSMIDDDRLTRAKIELRRSVYALQPPQRFEVIFYNDEATPMPGGPLPRPADQRTKNQLTTWLHLIGPDGETEPPFRPGHGPRAPARCRLPALRRRVSQGDRRGRSSR